MRHNNLLRAIRAQLQYLIICVAFIGIPVAAQTARDVLHATAEY